MFNENMKSNFTKEGNSDHETQINEEADLNL